MKEHIGSRLASLGPDLAEELEVHWNGYATRRGPRAYGRNTLKLASLLSGGRQPGEAEDKATDALAAALDLALVLEALTSKMSPQPKRQSGSVKRTPRTSPLRSSRAWLSICVSSQSWPAPQLMNSPHSEHSGGASTAL